MPAPLRLLVLGTTQASDRVARELHLAPGAFEVARTSSVAETVSALASARFDAVVAWLPEAGTRLRDLGRLVKAAGEVPVIVVLAADDATCAGDVMRAGARDCVTDDGQWGRLAPAVQRELAAAAARRERRVLEGQLRHAFRMEALGRLASGIAHDFNNLLTAVTGYSELLIERLDPHDPLRKTAEDIRGAAVRASGLTRQLLTFSRRQEPSAAVLDLNALVVDMERMLRRLVGAHIDLSVTLAPGEARVSADRGQIEQVVMNLVVNARDAMPQGGRLRIGTANVDVPAAGAGVAGGPPPGPCVALEVQDTGHGIDEETQARLFEPFFTTKGPTKGTGLGLSTVAAVVRASGGSIAVESRVGEGTTFRILLPRVALPVTMPVARRGLQSLPRGTETILLVEDEPGVRELVRDLLARCGYTVIEATDVKDAIALFARHREEVHLLVTDVVMPQMNGRQLADRFAADRPGLKVLYMSGYTDDQVLVQGTGAAPPFLQKPFTPDVLARRVREVLDGAPPPP